MPFGFEPVDLNTRGRQEEAWSWNAKQRQDKREWKEAHQ